MLRQRVFTGLALLSALLALLFLAPTFWVYAVVSLVGLMMAWEWTALMGLKTPTPRVAYLALTALGFAAAWLAREHSLWIFAAAGAWWCLALVLLPGYPGNLGARKPSVAVLGLIGQLLMPPAILAIALLHAEGVWVLLYAMSLVWIADIGAYFAGRAFGRRKLAPEISPGKTVEGALGGFALCAVWAALWMSPLAALTAANLTLLFGLSLLIVVFSIVGDLTESLFKRLAGVKDSGTILPGHGGLLDRVDSLLAAMPVFALALPFCRP